MRATEDPSCTPRPDTPLINGFIPPCEFHQVKFSDVRIGDMLCGDPIWGNPIGYVVTKIEPSDNEALVVLTHGGMKFRYFKTAQTFRWEPEPATKMQYDRAVAQLRSLL